MMTVKSNSEAWIRRADEVLAQGHGGHYTQASEIFQFATSMLSALYGVESPQMRSLRENAEIAGKDKSANPSLNLNMLARGAIKNAKAELEAGLIEHVRLSVAGEVLGELVRVGKEILSEQTDAAKNVAAVLIAAAYEGVLRKMGEELAGLSDRPKLEEVISALKGADVLKGGLVHTASSYLKFRFTQTGRALTAHRCRAACCWLSHCCSNISVESAWPSKKSNPHRRARPQARRGPIICSFAPV